LQRSSWPVRTIVVGRAVGGAAHSRSAPFLAKEKLRAKHTELAAGVRTTANYPVGQYLKDWLETLNTQAESTVTGYRIMARQLIELIGNVKLADLTVRDVQFALGKLAKRLSTRSVRLARMILIQAMRNAAQMAAALGHASTRTTEVGYKHQLRPVTRTAAIALGPLFDSKAETPGGQS
jgi:hypothetical protein